MQGDWKHIVSFVCTIRLHSGSVSFYVVMEQPSVLHALPLPSNASALVHGTSVYATALESYRAITKHQNDIRRFLRDTHYLVECWVKFTDSNSSTFEVDGKNCSNLGDFLRVLRVDLSQDAAFRIHRSHRLIARLGDLYMEHVKRFTYVRFATPHSCPHILKSTGMIVIRLSAFEQPDRCRFTKTCLACVPIFDCTQGSERSVQHRKCVL